MSTADRALSMVDAGDTLSIDPDVGAPYRATVEQVNDEDRCVTIRFQTKRGRKRKQIPATELATLHVQGRLLINPPTKRPVDRRYAGEAQYGGPY